MNKEGARTAAHFISEDLAKYGAEMDYEQSAEYEQELTSRLTTSGLLVTTRQIEQAAKGITIAEMSIK